LARFLGVPHVVDCSFNRPEDWSPLLDAVQSCHFIQRKIQSLITNLWGYIGGKLIAFPAATGKTALPPLTLLELRGVVVNLAPPVSQFLRHCDIPKLESLNIRLI